MRAQLTYKDVVGALEQIDVFLFQFSEHANAETRSRERMTVDELARQAQLHADATHFVLEQFAQRLEQFQMHAFGQSAHIVMRLDHMRLAGFASGGFDYVGIDRALRQPADAVELRGLFFKYLDEHSAYRLALGFRIRDALERRKIAVACVDADDIYAHVLGHCRHHLVAFVQAQQTCVDKNARQLLTDGAFEQRGDDGRIYAAGKSQ